MKIRRFFVVTALLLFLIVLTASYAAWYLLNEPYKAFSEPKILVTISPGTSLDGITRLLHRNGVIRHPLLLRAIFAYNGTEGKSKAGDYVFDRRLTPFQVYEKLMKGEMTYTVVTVPEGATIFDIRTELEQKKVGTTQDFQAATFYPEVQSLLHQISPEVSNPEGFLFPETYFYGKKDSIQKAILVMIRQFQKHYGEVELRRAQELGMTTLQVITMASMIEKETAVPAERALISGVFQNRLKKSMLLQCDPTVIYALVLEGKYNGNLSREDLKIDSPYNTYISPGLPPGPICNPGKASILAALYPEQTNMLYFVAKNDGSHHFSATLEEHQRAVRQYRR